MNTIEHAYNRQVKAFRYAQRLLVARATHPEFAAILEAEQREAVERLRSIKRDIIEIQRDFTLDNVNV